MSPVFLGSLHILGLLQSSSFEVEVCGKVRNNEPSFGFHTKKKPDNN